MPVLQSSNHVSYMGLKGFALNHMGHWSCPYLISNRQLGWQDTDMVQKGGTTAWSEERGTKAGNTCQGQYSIPTMSLYSLGSHMYIVL